jgi:hypothetical protein
MNDVVLSFFLFVLLIIRAFGPVVGSQLGVAWPGSWGLECDLLSPPQTHDFDHAIRVQIVVEAQPAEYYQNNSFCIVEARSMVWAFGFVPPSVCHVCDRTKTTSAIKAAQLLEPLSAGSGDSLAEHGAFDLVADRVEGIHQGLHP